MASLISYKQYVNEVPDGKGKYFVTFTVYNVIFLIVLYALGGQGVHLRHHVQRPGQRAVFQLHRHLRIVLLGGVLHFIGTGVGA